MLSPFTISALGLLGAALPAAALELQPPVPCPAEGCLIQHHYDHDPGAGARDYACGALVYDGHDGVDFRVPNLKDMAAGVPVRAAAPGRVARTRDGEPDARYDPAKPGATAERECGNGVAIAHADGYETQYCHLKEGTVRVRPGETVEAGQPLGQVGMSGMAQFPHLHLTVRKDGRPVDPFRPGGDVAACAADLGASLWSARAREVLAYKPAVILDGGFSGAPVALPSVEAGTVPGFEAGDAALVAWGRAIGLRRGDVMAATLRGPSGEVLAENRSPAFERDRAQHMLFAGRRRPPSGWRPGRYTLEVAVERGGREVGERVFALDVGG